jgi:hypothetical protein
MATPPEGLTLKRNRDLAGLERRPVVRWILCTLLVLFLVLGLLNVFGQRPATTSASAPGAELHVYSPSRVRGGLVFESRFHIDAIREIRDATLVLDPGWLEGMTLNTVEPSPVGESSRDGRIAFQLGHIPAGSRYLLFLQFSVNPTNVGRRPADVDLYDGDTRLLHVDRTITVWP